jgi:hypothetical protein
LKLLLTRAFVAFALCVFANLLGVWAIASSLRWGMDAGLSAGEIAINLISWPSIGLAMVESVLLLAVSARLLTGGVIAFLPMISAVVGAYYYVMFFSYYVWGNRLEPWLDLRLEGVVVTIIFVVALVLPYAFAFCAQRMIPRRPA